MSKHSSSSSDLPAPKKVRAEPPGKIFAYVINTDGEVRYIRRNISATHCQTDRLMKQIKTVMREMITQDMPDYPGNANMRISIVPLRGPWWLIAEDDSLNRRFKPNHFVQIYTGCRMDEVYFGPVAVYKESTGDEDESAAHELTPFPDDYEKWSTRTRVLFQ